MKIRMIIFILVTTGEICINSAQELSTPDTLRLRKHELSIEITPLFYLLNVETNRDHLYLGYKYHLPKLTLRASLSSAGTEQPQWPGPYSQITFEDSAFVLHSMSTYRSNGFLQLGLEKRKQGPLFTFYGGIDLVLGTGTETSRSVQRKYSQSAEGIYILNDLTSDDYSEMNTTFLNIGISPFIGLDMKVNELISAGLVAPVYLFYSHPLSSDQEEMPESRLDYTEQVRLVVTIRF